MRWRRSGRATGDGTRRGCSRAGDRLPMRWQRVTGIPMPTEVGTPAAVAVLGTVGVGRSVVRNLLNVMITSAIPVIAVSDSARAEDYYWRVLGFERMFA